MALQVLEGLSPADQVRMSAGSDFGSALGTGLQSLANQKMKQLQGSAFSKFNNIPPQIAQILPYLDPKIQKIFLERGFEGNNELSPQDKLIQELSESFRQQGKQGTESQEQESQEQESQDPQMSSMNAFNMMYGQPLEQSSQEQPFQQKQPSDVGTTQQQPSDGGTPLSRNVQEIKQYDKELQTVKNAEKTGLRLGKTPQEKYQQEVLGLKREELIDKKKEKSLEIKGEQYKTIQSADRNIRNYGKMLELDVNRELDSPGFIAFLENAGLGSLQALKSPGSQEFMNIRKDFLSNLKEIFGSRLNQFEVEQYLEAIPGLLNSPEGRKAMIKNAMLVEEGKKAQAQNVFDILKENKNVVPEDFFEQRIDRDSKKLDQIAKDIELQFKKIKVPETNRLKTAAQAAAGKVVGAIPAIGKAIAKAGTGAYTGAQFGKQFGPYGAGIGGGLGGLAGLLS